MTRCAIVGGSGYTGGELLRILSVHPGAKVTSVTSRQYEGKPISGLFPSLRNVLDLEFEAYDPVSMRERADVVFTAVPHKAAMPVVRELLDTGLKVIDLSADFRLDDPDVYEAWYSEHTEKDLIGRAVYGLPELYRDQIRQATLVANPGCYPTSAILPLFPLLKQGVIEGKDIIIDSKSGVSGAGRGHSYVLGYSEINEGFKAYKVTEHRHTPEIEQELSKAAGTPVTVNFTPHLVPMTRGILTTIYARVRVKAETVDILHALKEFYLNEPFIRILEEGQFPDCHYVRGSNFIDIGARVDARTNRLILVSAIDNLVKGASGQAVQNMNIMEGLPEMASLEAPPLFP